MMSIIERGRGCSFEAKILRQYLEVSFAPAHPALLLQPACVRNVDRESLRIHGCHDNSKLRQGVLAIKAKAWVPDLVWSLRTTSTCYFALAISNDSVPKIQNVPINQPIFQKVLYVTYHQCMP